MKKEETIGSRLKKARIKLDLTFDEVYKAIKIHPKILESLEEDRADPTIGEIYIKGFLKKYAKFLGFDADSIVSQFATGSSFKEPKRIGLINIGKEKHTVLIVKERFKKSALPLIAGLALISTIFIIGYSGYRLINELSGLFKRAEKVETPSPLIVPKNLPLTLKVETKDDVWLRVKSDGKVIFEHTLPKNSHESWEAKDELELWVGRAEALKLTLNDKILNLQGRGRIRKIIIDHQGLRVEKK